MPWHQCLECANNKQKLTRWKGHCEECFFPRGPFQFTLIHVKAAGSDGYQQTLAHNVNAGVLGQLEIVSTSIDTGKHAVWIVGVGLAHNSHARVHVPQAAWRQGRTARGKGQEGLRRCGGRQERDKRQCV